MDKEEKTLKKPRGNSNILSEITFAWLFKIFVKGYNKELTEFDLSPPLKEHSTHLISKHVEKSWDEEKAKCKKNGKIDPSLFRVLWNSFGTEFLFWSFVQFLKEILIKTSKPILLGKVLSYFNRKSEMSVNEVSYWIAGLILNLIIHSFFEVQTWNKLQLLGMKIGIACSSLIYGKVLRLPKTSFESETTVGQIINLLGNDTKNLDAVLDCANYAWISPIQTLLIAYLIYQEYGLFAVSGVFIFFMTAPLQGYLGKIVSRVSLKAALETDKRLCLTNESISGVQVIKMFAWEKCFLCLVDQVRRKELMAVTKLQLGRLIAVSCDMFNSRISLLVSLLLCVMFNNNNTLNAENLFMLVLYYDTVQANMNTMLPAGIYRGGMWFASMKRIEKFLLHKSKEYSFNDNTSTKQTTNHHNSTALSETISLKNASARWSTEDRKDTLKNINFSAKCGSLVAIVGQVASGKTSLLKMILQELPLTKGSIRTVGKISYVSQNPWIFSSSIRQNIIFTKPMNKDRYEEVVKVCQLERDFSLFPYKDQTIVAEKGINLSGGQKARIALARAVYADADIYLLDDPLSAVDNKVGRLIFNDCICSFLEGKTRILVTHQLQYLKSVDYVYILNNGSVQEEGTYQDLQTGKISIKEFQNTEEEDKDSTTQSSIQTSINPCQFTELTSDHQQQEVAEHRTIGKLSRNSYFSYFKAAENSWLIFLVFSLATVRQLIISGGDYCISLWAEAQQFGGSFHENVPYLVVYGGLIALLILVVYSFIFAYAKMCRKSSQKLHSSMLYSIIRSKMVFFYNNSSGRILNRFSKDMGMVDKQLPLDLQFMIRYLLQILVVIGMTISLNYWLLIPTICTVVVLYFFLDVYMKTSRSVKRLNGITQSPIIRHLSDTLQGLESVRAFGAQGHLTQEFERHLDLQTSSLSLYFGCTQFLRLYIEIAFEIYIAIVAYIFLFLDQHNSIANVGLIITQIIILGDTLAWGMYNITEAENNMTSVERVLEYSNIDQEPHLESSADNKPPENWPIEGRVEFKNVYLRYHPEGTDVLKNINFVISPREKIGIVGRTGAGKSSLIAALFRLSHFEGEIYIDGVPTSNLGLHDLRSKISIIPQEPLLFAGTIRRNMDPFDEYPDAVIWQALDEVELKTTIVGMAAGLESSVSNFSMGQRQLLCLVRAIIKKNKILVLDEATANVDAESDSLIQNTIKKRFDDCTVFIIAHRLNTIADCDRIMVLDAGRVLEFDQPFALLKKDHGFFYDMVQQTGSENVNNLMEMLQSTKI